MAEEDEITLREPKPGEKAAPLWRDRILFETDRHICVELWAPSEKYPQYGHTLRLVEEREVDGEWEKTTIILSEGGSTIFLTEAIEQAWAKLREILEEG